MNRPRIADVARVAGVSTATVSFVLNGRDARISAETKDRVRRAAADIGYMPNTVARGLRMQRTHTLGLISDEIATTPFAGRMIAGAQHAAREAEHLLILVNTDGDPAVEADAVAALGAQQVDAMIYAAMWHRLVQVPAALPPGSVLLDCRSETPGFPSVVPDEYAGARDAVTRLVEAGHRRIGFVDADVDLLASRLRRRAWQDVLGEADLPTTAYAQSAVSVAGGLEGAERLLAGTERPTALFCFNDRMASGAYRAARRHGLDVPRDLSVVGFDDQQFVAADLDPPLTTVALPHYDMGRWAVETALGGRRVSAEAHLMPCRLVERESVGPPPAPTP